MLMLLDIVKAVLEVAGLALLGQGLLFLFAGSKRDKNIVYQGLSVVTRPVLRLTRFVTPRVVLDRHLGPVAFLFVAIAWFFVLVEKQSVCTEGALGQPSCSALAAEYVKRCKAGQEASCEVLRLNGLAGDKLAPEQTP